MSLTGDFYTRCAKEFNTKFPNLVDWAEYPHVVMVHHGNEHIVLKKEGDEPDEWQVKMDDKWSTSYHFRRISTFQISEISFKVIDMPNWTTKEFVQRFPLATKWWANNEAFQVYDCDKSIWLNVRCGNRSVPGYCSVKLLDGTEQMLCKFLPSLTGAEFRKHPSSMNMFGELFSAKGPLEIQTAFDQEWTPLDATGVYESKHLGCKISIFNLSKSCYAIRQAATEVAYSKEDLQGLVVCRDVIAISKEGAKPVAVGTLSYSDDCFYLGGVVPLGDYDDAAKTLFDNGFILKTDNTQYRCRKSVNATK